jgi:hypothetical protein
MPQPTGNPDDERKTGNRVVETFMPPVVPSNVKVTPTESFMNQKPSVGRMPLTPEVCGSKPTGGNKADCRR